MTDDLSSWDLRIDHALGQAERVLQHASDLIVKGTATEDAICGAVALSQSWRDLAEAWVDRQAHEVALAEAEAEAEADDEETTTTEDDEEGSYRNLLRRGRR